MSLIDLLAEREDLSDISDGELQAYLLNSPRQSDIDFIDDSFVPGGYAQPRSPDSFVLPPSPPPRHDSPSDDRATPIVDLCGEDEAPNADDTDTFLADPVDRERPRNPKLGKLVCFRISDPTVVQVVTLLELVDNVCFNGVVEGVLFQLEVGGNTSRVHVQGMLRLQKQLRISEFWELLNVPRGAGTQSTYVRNTFDGMAAYAYCSKEETRIVYPPLGYGWISDYGAGPHEIGDLGKLTTKGQGKRTDLDDFREELVAHTEAPESTNYGWQMKLLKKKAGNAMMRCHSFTDKWLSTNCVNAPEKIRPIVTWLYGDSGSGKSADAKKYLPAKYRELRYSSPFFYNWHESTEGCLINNFVGEIPYVTLIKMLDTTCIASVRMMYQGDVWFNPTHIVITARKSPKEMYIGTPDYDEYELWRRISNVIKYDGHHKDFPECDHITKKCAGCIIVRTLQKGVLQL